MLVYVAFLVVMLALIGALLHPFLTFLYFIHPRTPDWLVFLDRAKIFIADFFFWGIFSLLAISVVIITKSRLMRKAQVLNHNHRCGQPIDAWAESGSTQVVVAMTAYDDAPSIGDAVRDFKVRPEVEKVIVIDNNSRDRTSAQAEAAGASVVEETRQGYGYACIRGLEEALKVPGVEVIVLTEGDGTFSAADLQKFLAYINQADMVIGTRVVPGLAEQDSQMDHFFIWGNVVISTLLRLRFWNSQFLGAARLSDVGCTFRVIRRGALERILPDLVVGGSHFSLHMMLIALARKLAIIEIPITFRRRVGQSKGASRSILQGLIVGFAMIWHIMTYITPGPARLSSSSEEAPEPEMASRPS
ncbi:MAG TPA: glycosyltransferase family 2 protein [bacterium]|nr:glycosyltransferase family 2 protein [bacterium]